MGAKGGFSRLIPKVGGKLIATVCPVLRFLWMDQHPLPYFASTRNSSAAAAYWLNCTNAHRF
jgi:hypothetical protein